VVTVNLFLDARAYAVRNFPNRYRINLSAFGRPLDRRVSAIVMLLTATMRVAQFCFSFVLREDDWHGWSVSTRSTKSTIFYAKRRFLFPKLQLLRLFHARQLAWAFAGEQRTPRAAQVYFLVADAIGTSLPDVIGTAAAAKPRPATRYLCRNPASRCCGEPTIGGYTKSRNTALFRCPECGFAYCDAIGPTTVKRRFKISEVGPVWKARLRELWRRRSNSLQVIADELGVGRPRVIVEALRAGLPPIKREGFSGRFGKSARAQTGEREDRRKKHRRIWQEARRRYPKKNRTELTKLLPATRGWLDKNDHVWFRAHLPKAAKRRGRVPLDWRPHDSTAARLVVAAAQRLNGRRISWHGLVRELGPLESRIVQNCRRLPKTSATFKKLAEEPQSEQQNRRHHPSGKGDVSV